jgi:hypothetical protein
VAVKRAFDAVLDAHDVDAALALFAGDAVLRTPSGAALTGRPQLRAYLQQLVVENIRAETVQTRQVAPDRVTSSGRIALDPLRRLGLPWVEATADVTVREGRIAALATALTPAAAARVPAAPAGGAPPGLPRTGAAGGRIPRRGSALAGAAVLLAGAVATAARWRSRWAGGDGSPSISRGGPLPSALRR